MNEANSREPAAMDDRIDVNFRNTQTKSNRRASDCTANKVIETKNFEPIRVSALVHAGNFFFKYRNIISPLVFCGLAFTTKPLIIAGNRRLDMYLDGIGIVIALTGQLLRIGVIGFAYIKRGGKKNKVYAETLVQEGFFAHCRNPLYVGNILILIGLIIIHNSIWLCAFGVPFFLFLYWSITTAEENYLRKKFGRVYDDYTRRVPRFLISFRGLAHTLKGMKFDLKKVILKEYGTIFVFVTTVMALLVWEGVTADGFEAARGYLYFMLILWSPVVLAYSAAFFAKKTGVLSKN